ncbi:unnamed protein product [Mytilus coruscus]|uniref:Uncharacterized protein n=1 Tax=Mytilus coruscus TaxID=42192 RepID=A0A6J8ALW7_MYTCO|nr:unnamed protein product [Mytilus coruscus]
MDKPVILMEATLDQLQSIEGIDSEMATQILEARDSSHFIDLNVVFGITGVPKSTLKKHFVEPGMSFFYQKLRSEIAEVRQELKQDISNVTSGLQEDEHHEQVEKLEKFGAFGSTVDTLIAQKNQQAEEKFGTKSKIFSTPASSTTFPDFPKMSPITKPSGPSNLGESYTTNTNLQDDMYPSAASTLKLSTASEVAKQNHEKTNTEVPVGKGPSAPPFVISNIEPAQSTTEVQSEPSLTKQEQLESQSKDGQGPLVPPITSNNEAHYNTSTHETNQNVLQDHAGQGTLAPSSAYNPIIVQGSTIPNKPPFWSYNVPPPGVQHNVGLTVPPAAVFYPGSNKETSNIPSIPVHWNTPVVMPSHEESVNNTSVQTNSLTTPERHRGRGRKRCQRESSSSIHKGDRVKAAMKFSPKTNNLLFSQFKKEGIHLNNIRKLAKDSHAALERERISQKDSVQVMCDNCNAIITKTAMSRQET